MPFLNGISPFWNFPHLLHNHCCFDLFLLQYLLCRFCIVAQCSEFFYGIISPVDRIQNFQELIRDLRCSLIHAPLSTWTLQISFHQILLTAYGAPRFDSWAKHPLKCHAGYNTIWIHSALCPLFTLSIRVLHSNAGHIDKKLFVMSLFPLTPGHIVEKSLVMSPSPSAPGHIDKKSFTMSH